MEEKCSVTEQEATILRMVATGLTNKGIAHVLNIAERTVEFHISKLFAKTGVDSRVRLAVVATKWGLFNDT